LGYSTSHCYTNIDTSGLSLTPLNESNTGVVDMDRVNQGGVFITATAAQEYWTAKQNRSPRGRWRAIKCIFFGQ